MLYRIRFCTDRIFPPKPQPALNLKGTSNNEVREVKSVEEKTVKDLSRQEENPLAVTRDPIELFTKGAKVALKVPFILQSDLIWPLENKFYIADDMCRK
jgi:hypothetical protein